MQIVRQTVQKQGRYCFSPSSIKAMDLVYGENENLAFLLLHGMVSMNKQLNRTFGVIFSLV